MQIAYPCKCAEREKRGTLAPEAVVRQHLVDAHAHTGPANGDRWKPADIDDPAKWPVRELLALESQVPLVGQPVIEDAEHPDYGPVQVTRNHDGSVRSVFTVREGEDGRDVTQAFVQFWDHAEKPAAKELKTTKQHGA